MAIEVTADISKPIAVTAEVRIQSVSGGAVDVNYSNGDPSPLGSIPAPGSVNIPQHQVRNVIGTILQDGEYDDNYTVGNSRAKNSEDTVVAEIPAEGEAVIADSGVYRTDESDVVEGSSFVTIPVKTNHTLDNHEIKDDEDAVIGKHMVGKDIKIMAEIDEINHFADRTEIVPVVPAAADIAFARVPVTQNSSKRDGDEGWHANNDTFDDDSPVYPEAYALLDWDAVNPFETLKNNNQFDNKNRYTNDLGGTVTDGSDGSTANHWMDHLYKCMFRLTHVGTLGWDAGIDAIHEVDIDGYTDWMMITRAHMWILWNMNLSSSNLPVGFPMGFLTNAWTSTFNPDSQTQRFATFSNGQKRFGSYSTGDSKKVIAVRFF